MPRWHVGAAERDISPPLGLSMTGYAGRPGPANHILDRLSVRALAVRSENGPLAVLTGADLLGIDAQTAARIRGLLADVVPPALLLLNHAHTHAGPTTSRLRCMGTMDADYVEFVAQQTAAAVREALENLCPASLRLGTSTTSIGRNRRELRDGKIVLGDNSAGPYDPTVTVLRAESEDGSAIACWFSHACHPVVMGPQNTGISAEWPGEAASTLELVLGCPAVFAQGCCGDVNPVRRGGHDVVRSVGRELAGSAIVAWERAEPLPVGEIRGARETVSLPQRQPEVAEAEDALAQMRTRLEQAGRATDAPSAAHAQARVEAARDLVGWAEDYLAAAKAPTVPPVEMEVQAIRLGDFLIVATAAETFSEIGAQIRERSPLPHTVSLGYSNGCFGYLPTAKAFPLGGYEVDAAYRFYGTLIVTPECERLTLEAAERVMSAVTVVGNQP